MIKKLKFESIADLFSDKINSGNPRMSSVSRCDYVIIKDKEILFIEETNLMLKDLLNPRVYTREIVENVKKMWGSITIFMYYISAKGLIDEVKGKDRIYILLLWKFDGKTVRALSNMIKTLIKYRNGGYADVKYVTREDVDIRKGAN